MLTTRTWCEDASFCPASSVGPTSEPLAIKMTGGKDAEPGSPEDTADLRATLEALVLQVEDLEQRLEGKQS